VSPEQYQKLLTEGGCLDLSARAKWRLSGSDRVRYLNGQVTQDVRQANASSALHACVTNVKGKIEADIFIHVMGDSLILDAPESLRESLSRRLERYIIADDAELEDITEEWKIWHCFGNMAQESANVDTKAGHRILSSRRLGLSGNDVWFPISENTPKLPISLMKAEDAECFRILQKIPIYPNELNSETFPQEAGLEKETMSYTKGCYIGQEILSRIKTTGKMPREMIVWQSNGSELIRNGASLSLAGKIIGTITSQTMHPLSETTVGIGFIRQGMAAMDSELLVADEVSSIPAVVKITTLFNP
jgi:folate-binding protein YgfZ